MTAGDGLNEGDFPITQRNKLKRMPERGVYDRETVFKILDDTFICHLGYTFEGRQYVMPQAFALDKQKQKLYFHGSITNRMLKTMKVSRTCKSKLIPCEQRFRCSTCRSCRGVCILHRQKASQHCKDLGSLTSALCAVLSEHNSPAMMPLTIQLA